MPQERRQTRARSPRFAPLLPMPCPAGALYAVTYLDNQALLASDGHMAVFAADFAKDSRLCGIELVSGNQINRFACA